jgi:colanic acid/amylovoran biosynthesis glycosyltransferase
MRIAFLVHRFPAISETFILRQIAGLMDLGHEVDIYSERSPNEGEPVHPEFERYAMRARTTYLDKEMPAESGHWSMPVRPVWGRTWLPGADRPVHNAVRVLRAMPTFLRSLASAPALTIEALQPSVYPEQARTLEALYHLSSLSGRTGRYDVIHAHFGPVANNLLFARDVWQAPLVVTFHGYDYCTVPREKGRDVYDRLFQHADLFTIHSEYGRKRLLELGCPVEKLCRLHVGIDLTEIRYRARKLMPGEKVRILTVARLVPIKGISCAIEAIAQLRDRGMAVCYDVVGDGPERSNLEQHIRRLGLERIVKLHGFQESNTVTQMLDDAHIFLLPSIDLDGDQEGTPVSLMEAQAAGLPVVASSTGGIPEVVRDGITGQLFPERNVAALVETLFDLIQHSERWPEIGAQGREHVERNFDLKTLSHELVAIYQQAIRSAAIPVRRANRFSIASSAGAK